MKSEIRNEVLKEIKKDGIIRVDDALEYVINLTFDKTAEHFKKTHQCNHGTIYFDEDEDLCKKCVERERERLKKEIWENHKNHCGQCRMTTVRCNEGFEFARLFSEGKE